MSKSHRLELQHKKMLRASIAARPSHTQTIFDYHQQRIAHQNAAMPDAIRSVMSPDYVPVPARDELTTFADDSDSGSNTNMVNRAISYLRQRAHSLVETSEYGQVSPELANVADALQILTRIGGGVHV